MNQFNTLLNCLDKSKRIVVHVHDFPDHDAVSSGFALCSLLKTFEYTALLCYSGRMESTSLSSAVKFLNIPLVNTEQFAVTDNDQFIIVDGFVSNKNIPNISGQLVAIIDHHSPPETPRLPFYDIREHIGSCATIIYSYYQEYGIEPEKEVATALLMGLLMDTAFMTRGVTPEDMNAFSTLFFMGDWQSGIRLLKNSLSLQDLQVFREAINSCEVAQKFAFVPLQKECSPEVAAIIADFFLDIQEITFVVVLIPDRDEYRISVRSEDSPSDIIIRQALKGVGYGGGHWHMGGGTIPRDLFPGQETLRNRFLHALNA